MEGYGIPGQFITTSAEATSKGCLVRESYPKNERLVHFHTPAEAVAHRSNLAEQTINTWKIVTHLQSLTPQHMWPSMVSQGKVSSLFLLGNPILYDGFFVEACQKHSKVW